MFWVTVSVLPVGKVGQNSLTACGGDLLKAKDIFKKKWDCAINSNIPRCTRWRDVKTCWFCSRFLDKTKNEWEHRATFEKVPGKYDMVFMDYSADDKARNQNLLSNLRTDKLKIQTLFESRVRSEIINIWKYFSILGGEPEHRDCCAQKEGLHAGREDSVTPGANLRPQSHGGVCAGDEVWHPQGSSGSVRQKQTRINRVRVCVVACLSVAALRIQSFFFFFPHLQASWPQSRSVQVTRPWRKLRTVWNGRAAIVSCWKRATSSTPASRMTSGRERVAAYSGRCAEAVGERPVRMTWPRALV